MMPETRGTMSRTLTSEAASRACVVHWALDGDRSIPCPRQATEGKHGLIASNSE